MQSKKTISSAPVHAVVLPPRIKLHFDPNYSTFGYWWKEIAFIPAEGTGVIPFEEADGLDWCWDHDTVKVWYSTFFAQGNLVCVQTKVSGDWDFMPPDGFDDAMRRAGWNRGDAMAWE
jgi:hypothetical protein